MARVGLPLVHEDEAEGLVSAVFVDIRARMPFVPALFKALAGDPEVLVAAWLQARAIYDDPRSTAAAAAIRSSAQVEIGYRPSARVRTTLAPYADELPRMLLIVSSLQLTLAGELPLQPAPEPNLPQPATVPEPEFPDRAEHPLFANISAAYGTQHLPSIFRTLAANSLLEQVWDALGPFLASPEGANAIDEVNNAADTGARAIPEVACFQLARAQPTLDQFSRALPRNMLIAVAGCAEHPAD
jgi:hypothetical protein